MAGGGDGSPHDRPNCQARKNLGQVDLLHLDPKTGLFVYPKPYQNFPWDEALNVFDAMLTVDVDSKIPPCVPPSTRWSSTCRNKTTEQLAPGVRVKSLMTCVRLTGSKPGPGQAGEVERAL